MSDKPASLEERWDGWYSALTAIGGVISDKTSSAMYSGEVTNVIENAEIWRTDPLGGRIVELVPNEMLRQGFELSIEGEAGKAKDKIKDITAFWEDLGLVEKLHTALCYERAYGGAAILLGVNDLKDMREPLKDEDVTEFKWLEVFEPMELQAVVWQNDPNLAGFGWPEIYRLNPVSTGGSKVTGVEIHASRLLRFPGIRVSRRQLSAQAGWGDAVLTRCRGPLRDFQIAWRATAILVNDFAQAVFKIKGLAELIALGKDEELKNRIRAMELSRSVARALVIDAEAEEFERKQTPLTGLPELLDKYGVNLAASADTPVTLLMGTSPGGLNATGESDVRGFYDRIKSQQIRKLRSPIERVVKLTMQVLEIEEPDSWSVKFHPLWQPTEKEQADTRFVVIQTMEKAVQNSFLSSEEVRKSLYGGPEFTMEVQIDPTLDLTPPPPMPTMLGPDGKSIATPNAPPTSTGIAQPAPVGKKADPLAIGKGAGPDAPKTRTDSVVERGGRFYVYSKDLTKKLGGPYKTRAEADERLGQVEEFKSRES